MDWVHCNNCYVQPGQVDGKKFVITNCGHIYCLDCTLLPDMKQCRICRFVYNTMPLSSKMSKEVESYFRDPIDDLRKQLKILEFQQDHRSRLSAHQRERLARYATLKKENATLRDELKRKHAETESLRAEVAECKKRLELSSTHGKYPIGHRSSHNVTPQGSGTSGVYGGSGNSSRGRTSTVLKRPPESSSFFSMSSNSKREESGLFKTPAAMKTPGSHWSLRTGGSNFSTPPTPIMKTSDSSQRDPLHRKIRLPGDRGGPSPSMTSSFLRLSLNKLTSTPKSELMSKYSQYFSKK